MKTHQSVLIATWILLTSIFSVKTSLSQDYRTGIGLRLGGLHSGLSIRHNTGSATALEGILGFGYRSSFITGLYEINRTISSTPGMKWYYGAGAHLGMFQHKGTYWYFRDRGRNVYVVEPGHTVIIPGVDFILGLEYKFNNAPFTLGLDIKPFIDVHHGLNGYFDGALNFRFVF
ncbi:MAG: hypothetical protein DWQ44_09195 [Bacteroidetes bacterium]|nr:MAG: hypothetical protein DWQ33_02580 [Bacteroidota bacterium]REK06463.1 MAG: hypothetical protein DWQ39_02985 [Bacteroidota bacterium]REK33229.1 MAG: hypothetical protein DWQ44_09195 [Bacteroidota bacterium]REK47066.1 MAG: hypothetical protein DWQ48_13530 [Bacteroidota bacterium]